MGDNNSLVGENLASKKLELEIEKLDIENNQLKRKWYQKISVYASLVPSIVTIILLFIGYQQDYINLKLESLKQKEVSFSKKESNLIVKKDSLVKKQNVLIDLENHLNHLKVSLDSIDNEINDRRRLLEIRSTELVELDSILDIKQVELKKRLLIIEEEEQIANIRFNIKQIVSKDGFLTYDEEDNLESFIRNKDKNVSKLTFKIITDIVKTDTLTPTVKGTLLKVLCDATNDKKWYSEIVTLYKKEYKNIPHNFFRLFERVNVTDGNSKYIDATVKYKTVELMLESLDYPGFQPWNQQDIFGVISSIIYSGVYDKLYFTNNFSAQFLNNLEKKTCIFLVDIISNPHHHRDTTRNIGYGRTGFPYDVHHCTDILFTLNSQYLSASIQFLKVKSTFVNREFLLFDEDVKYLNSNLKDNSKLCKITPVPNILSDKADWVEWGSNNKCIIEKFIRYTSSN